MVAGLLAARRAKSRHPGAAGGHHAAAVDAIAAMIAEEAAHGMVAGLAGGVGPRRRLPGQPRPHLKRSVAVGGQRRLAWAGGSLLSSVLDAFNRVSSLSEGRFHCGCRFSSSGVVVNKPVNSNLG